MQIAYLPAKLAGELAGGPERLLFMGLWKETAVFAVDLEGPANPTDGGPLEGLGKFEDLRAVALKLPDTEAAIIATAKHMFEWRRRHQHCAVCGQPSEPRGRLETPVPVMRGRALPAHRSRGDHARGPRGSLHGGPPGALAQGHVFSSGRLP